MPTANLLVEAVASVGLIALLITALRIDIASVVQLLTGACFGLAAEIFFVTQFDGYQYGQFAINLPAGRHESVPLWIALGWGSIIWVSMQAAARMQLPWYIQPLASGLLALSLDISLDPVAVALGWWHWLRPAHFFGIPCDNFLGWLLIVTSYSFFVQLGRQLQWLAVVVNLLASLPAVAVIVGTQYLLPTLYTFMGEPQLFLVCVLLWLGLTLTAKSKATMVPAWYLNVIPSLYHGLMLIFAVVVIKDPALFVLIPVAWFSSLIAFRFPRSEAHANQC